MSLESLELEALRPFWYPVLPVEECISTPQALTILGRRLVLWRTSDDEEQFTIADDRCCHRSARLSDGRLTNTGCIVCPYHGWEFHATGQCTHIPQEPHASIPDHFRIQIYPTAVRYGYIWLCLEAHAHTPIPNFPEAGAPNVRLIHGFFEMWRCSPFRIIENGLDNYHHFFVHRGLLDAQTAVPEQLRHGIEHCDDGFSFSIPLDVSNTSALTASIDDRATALTVERTVRWIAPLGLSLELDWPNGLQQRIVLYAVPIDENQTLIVRFYFRNDTDDDVSHESITQFERGLIDQDRRILEGITAADESVPLGECLIEADYPIALMRQHLRHLLKRTS